MKSKIVKKCLLWNNSFSIRQIKKYSQTKIVQKLHFYVYAKFKSYYS